MVENRNGARVVPLAAIAFAVSLAAGSLATAKSVVEAAEPPILNHVCPLAEYGWVLDGVHVVTEDQGHPGRGCDMSLTRAEAWATSETETAPLVRFDCVIIYPPAYGGPKLNAASMPRSGLGECVRMEPPAR